ncbi:MAG: hypothetical protein KAG61_03550 [Bacteriovoracaceae bacterium]|nr:hypothetical protein [Bacteriovoracaceae bacterium]
MESKIESALLVDTCSVYKLYFFVNEVIPEKVILVPALGTLSFIQLLKANLMMI